MVVVVSLRSRERERGGDGDGGRRIIKRKMGKWGS